MSMLSASVIADERVVVQLKWYHSFQFAGYYAAQKQGYFKDAGMDVILREIQPGRSVVDEVLNNSADFGVADSSIVLHRLNNKPVVIASTIFQSTPFVFIALQSSEIRTPYDFVGKKVMYIRNADDAVLQALLMQAGVAESDFQYVSHTYNDWALRDGHVDVMSAYRSDQPLLYNEKGIGINIIDPASYGIDFYGDMVFTSEKMVKSDRVKVDRFVSALHRGWLYALENPLEIAQWIAKEYQQPFNESLALEEARVISSLINAKFVPIGTASNSRLQQITNIYRQLDMVDGSASIDGILLSDYDDKPFEWDVRYWYGIVIIIGASLLIFFAQHSFNLRLKKIVTEKTLELAEKNTLLQANNQALSDAKIEADAANQAKSTFLSNMSHEIRTPLNAIHGVLQILKQRNTDTQNTQLIEKATLSSSSLMTIINDILDVSKIESGNINLEIVPFEMTKVIELVMSEQLPLALNKGVSISQSMPDNWTDGWLGDPVRVKQILLNLVSNAVKFTDAGNITIEIQEDNENLNFKVTDTGIGMNQNAIDKLFQRFEQADETITRRFGGTGLGMSITASLVSLMKGDIKVKSVEGKGSTFTVSLPLVPADISSTNNGKESDLTPPALANHYVVIAEDNEINQVIIRNMLEPTEVDIVIVDNGQLAIEQVELRQPSLLLMDIQMPVMGGMAACQAIKRHYPNLPIIALTANVMEDDVRAYYDAGFDGHIGKPIDLGTLYRELKRWLVLDESSAH
ncbi:ABC transporter substrate-binding protein [Alteromonas sp. KUL49]|uniref:ABC transporter substrate-binding protein n=1 Tax=Alteromonas sp. KUL49 TaxID=2480798 RepID=UPI00102EFD65|nr:ABC transporter substrate-binding protein [Alteromonas sp. KUL49]TAP35531.1 response regulator [Alteromonas sp. KUL49]